MARSAALLALALSALAILTTGAAAQSEGGPLPERRAVLWRDMDFPGGDLRTLLDTSLPGCLRACLSDARCTAFTFNARAGACFPKSRADAPTPYSGAVSARILATDPAVLAAAPARAAELGFLRDSDLAEAHEQAEKLPQDHPVDGATLEELRRAAASARAENRPAEARRQLGAAVALGDDAAAWTDYAAASAALSPEDSGARRRARGDALSAAVNAYLRGGAPALRARALEVMATALEDLGRGRDMIPALRLAQTLAPRDELSARLDEAIGKYGFRITDTVVESDAARPRICAEFSEDLVKARIDYAPFVQLPDPGLAVTAEDRRLCVEGLSHGERYRLTFRAGLPAASGETLAKPVTLTQYVRDRSPSVRFPGRAYVLPKTGGTALPVVTVNSDRLGLTLYRMSDRNLLRSVQSGYFGEALSPWEEETVSTDLAEKVWSGLAEVGHDLNRDVTTRLPLDEALAGQPAGIYALTAAIPGEDPYDVPAATQWFVLSDLGLASMSGTDGLHVFVRALGSAEPKSGIKVSLLSRANEVLGTAMTDAQGYARFEPGLTRGRAGAAPAMLTAEDGAAEDGAAEDGAADIAFLSLTDPEFDLSDRGVEGREPAPPIDVFLTTDRGAYRTGETVHATALARDDRAEAIADLPLTAILTRPDGLEHARQLSPGGIAGGHVFDLDIAGTAPRGTWTLDLYADPEAPALASSKILVEDFLPERIDFDLGLPEAPIDPAAPPLLSVEARYLFGAPGADLPIEGEVRLAAVSGLPAYPGFVFGRYDASVAPAMAAIEGAGRTDAAGQARIGLSLPPLRTEGQPVEARITLRLSEGSGRPVERSLTRPVVPSGPMVGIRPRFDGDLPEGAEAGFDLIVLGADGQPGDSVLHWALNRVETRYQWYRVDGDWAWEPITTRERIADGEARLENGRASVEVPVRWGRYELVAERRDGAWAEAAVAFEAGWYAPADASTTPDMLELSLDKPAYRPGETATLRIVPREAGKGLVTVMSNRLIDMVPVDLTEGENVVRLPVTDDWGAGAYVAATLIRPMDLPAGHNPARALGLAHAAVDPGPHRLAADFEVPAEAEPRQPLDIALKVDGIAPGETAYATIAAVDLGILNVTAFASPDPDDHYFGQRKLGMGLRDVYGRLIDGLNGAMGTVRSGGDGTAGMRRQAPPPTEELVALFSGPVTVGADGVARARLDIPAFNGTLRLMAVAWSPTGIGQAEADILIRDPVVVTASLPRFLAPGDESRLLLELVHAEGPAGRMPLSVTAEGVTLDPAAIPEAVELAEGGKTALSIPITAGMPGVHHVEVALTTPDGKVLSRTLTLPVEVTDPEVVRTSRFTLADGQSFTADDALFADMLPGTGRATLALGPIARLDAAGLLAGLDRYPYGCTEQVTSKALPLLYLDQVAEALGLGTRERLAERLDQAVTEVLANQSPSGGFGLWAPGAGDFWLDAYVTDFLSRARAQGVTVPDRAFGMALDNLQNRVNYAPDFDDGGEDIAYALMVLAREGKAAMADLRYYADTRAGAFATPLAAGQLGAALAAYGDPTRADLMFARAARMMAGRMGRAEPPVWRIDYGTDLRDAAGLLTLALAAGSTAVDRDALTGYLAETDRPLSTQEASWMLLATHELIDRPGAEGFTLNGAPLTGPLVRLLAPGEGPAVLGNDSGRAETLTVTSFGVPEVPDPAGGNGYAISRQHYTLEGDAVTLDAVPQGTRIVTVLEVTPFSADQARLMVSDPIPAGFEIDNPNLLRAGDIRALDWLGTTAEVQHSEARQDRFLAAIDWGSADPFRLAYILRATAPGTYRAPAASVEDMYRPDRRAWTDAGRASVTP
ncbi:alpha-2-macroglobulin family protein [Rhodovulum sp. BSW8]|uniref:alpha-2-macroglobulin family protein n=1 Tax=Rhodovulum sp. BSW8 TaxID=2259645 RepID=UPI000DE2498A|nr:alpha-2-macroglobulin family protein [Rhodovulum sp. BSW8]RBO53690.1 alpha-2-macroglobulin family protein [Rhodovulum sp. BSW8]